jgi:hypothetical protein
MNNNYKYFVENKKFELKKFELKKFELKKFLSNMCINNKQINLLVKRNSGLSWIFRDIHNGKIQND